MPKLFPRDRTLGRMIPYILIGGGIVGFIASFMLSIDKIKLLQNPDYQPLCSINPILSCVSVAGTPQADAFGFPNMFLGIAGFAALIAIGVGILAGARYKAWFWFCINLGGLFGVGFVHWLFYQSVYTINALCIYCMMVWAVVMPIFWYVTLYNLREGHLPTPRKLTKVVAFMQRQHGDILAVWYIVITILILKHFWYYFGTLL